MEEKPSLLDGKRDMTTRHRIELCTIPCNLCKGSVVSVLSHMSRSGKPLRTVICKRCGLVWSDPRPHDPKHFYEEEYRVAYKNSYKPRPKHILRAGQIALSRLEELEKIGPLSSSPKAILDVGTGGGEFAYLLQSLGHTVSGVEPNRGYADYSIHEYGLEIQVRFVLEASYPADAFDLVTMWHGLEHVENPRAVLAQLRSWLRSDGMLIIEVPNVEATCQSPRSTFHEAHLYNFNVLSLRRLAEQQGLHVVSCTLSRDGGNITTFLKRHSSPSVEHRDASISGNHERISAIIRGHTNLQHYMTPLPYVRAWQRLCRSLVERRDTAGVSRGKDLLDRLYSPHIRRTQRDSR